MFVSLKEILKNAMFDESKVLAGSRGLNKKIKRISVFDCPCNKNLVDRDIIAEGDVFITCLDQFKYETENIYEYLDTLIKTECSGLFVVTDDMLYVLSDDILQSCDQNNFPIVLIPEDIPYAAIIDTVNKYISIDNLNAINTLKIEKIMYGNVLASEKMEILYSINPNMKKFLRVIEVEGDFNSDIAQVELHFYYLKQKNDIYVRSNNQQIFILSDEDEKSLRRRSDVASIRIKEFVSKPVMGYSRIYNRKDIGKALEEAKRALETAKTMNMSSQTYDPLSVLQLLLTVKDTQEAHDFYRAYVDAIRQKASVENLKEILMTMESYVAHSGNFQAAAREMNQHENTIRYRVNKVKSALGMENDNVKFHETVAVAVKLRTLINEKL